MNRMHALAIAIAGVAAVAVTGAASDSTGASSVFSDARLKTNIVDLPEGTLDKVLSLRGRNFQYTRDAQRRDLGESGVQTGFIAQEVRTVFPLWVTEDDNGYLYITERGTTALMVEALRELRAEKDEAIKRLNDQVKTLTDADVMQMGLLIELTEDIKSLKNANTELRSRITALEKIVQAGSPNAVPGTPTPAAPTPTPGEP